MDRSAHVRRFLDGTPWAGREPVYLSGDASTRRYFRLPGAVLMDAPPVDGHSVSPFVHVTGQLRNAGLNAPKLYAKDVARGFLLLEDFGDATFAKAILADPDQELPLYRALIPILAQLDRMAPSDLPVYSHQQMADMTDLAITWYRWAITGDESGHDALQGPLCSALARCGGTAMSLRDFHAENLMWLPEKDGLNRIGLLDYQDAMLGPRGYDLVSLLLDARRDVSIPVIETVQAEYAVATDQPLDDVLRSFAILGAQRNLRILGIFTRLALKYGKPRYLDFLPRVWRYIESCVTHPDLQHLAAAVHATLPQPSAAMIESLRHRCGTVPNRP